MFPHKQQALVDNLQALGASTIPVPPSPDDITDMVALNIPVSKEKTSGKVIPMPIRKII